MVIHHSPTHRVICYHRQQINNLYYGYDYPMGSSPTTYQRQITPTPSMCTQGFLYTVTPGDTIYALASRYNLTPEDIIRANPQLVNPNILFPGQQLCIPVPIPVPPICARGFLYTVERGDTLFRIALQFDLTIWDILRANPQIRDPNIIFVGQQICIPLPIPQPNCINGILYTVRKGETLSSIASNFNITLEELIAANPQIFNPNLIFTGQQICIPI